MKIPKDRKMTFVEFVAYEESEEETIDDSWLKHWTKHIPNMLNEDYTKEHFGDCTKDSCPCGLCVLETLLKEYREYFLDKPKE